MDFTKMGGQWRDFTPEKWCFDGIRDLMGINQSTRLNSACGLNQLTIGFNRCQHRFSWPSKIGTDLVFFFLASQEIDLRAIPFPLSHPSDHRDFSFSGCSYLVLKAKYDIFDKPGTSEYYFHRELMRVCWVRPPSSHWFWLTESPTDGCPSCGWTYGTVPRHETL